MESLYYPKQDYKVIVRCFTYNQNKYIEDSLNGFAMQQTSFPFVCLVIDDCSTDGEQEVINDWMERKCDMKRAEYIDLELSKVIIVPHSSNKNCIFAFYLLKRNLYKEKTIKMSLVIPWREHCEYEAICEGDDYWTDASKLQKQYCFMEKNKDYSLCHTGFVYSEEGESINFSGEERTRINLQEISNNTNLAYSMLLGNRYLVQTMTAMYRLEDYYKAEHDLATIQGKFLMGDTQLWIALLKYGKIYFMPESTAIYRLHSGSSTHMVDIKQKLRFELSCSEMRVAISKFYGLLDTEIRYFEDKYKKMLLLYKAFDPKYRPFICVPFSNRTLEALYNMFTRRPLSHVVKLSYLFFIKYCI